MHQLLGIPLCALISLAAFGQTPTPPTLVVGTGVKAEEFVPVEDGQSVTETEWGGVQLATPAGALTASEGGWVVLMAQAHLEPSAQTRVAARNLAWMFKSFQAKNAPWSQSSSSWAGNFSAASGPLNAAVPIKVDELQVGNVIDECISLTSTRHEPDQDMIKGYGQPISSASQFFDVGWSYWSPVSVPSYARRSGSSTSESWASYVPRPQDAESWTFHFPSVVQSAFVSQLQTEFGSSAAQYWTALHPYLDGAVVTLTFQAVYLRSSTIGGQPVRPFTGPIPGRCGLDSILNPLPAPPDFRLTAPLTVTLLFTTGFSTFDPCTTLPVPPMPPIFPILPPGFAGVQGSTMCVYLPTGLPDVDLNVWIPTSPATGQIVTATKSPHEMPLGSVVEPWEFLVPSGAVPGLIYFGTPAGPLVAPPPEYAVGPGMILLVPIPSGAQSIFNL